MRAPSTSVESLAAPSEAESPTRPDMAKAMSGAMLALGFGLLLFIPLGAALLLVAGGLGLTIALESPTDQ
jgi:hypothetical protein